MWSLLSRRLQLLCIVVPTMVVVLAIEAVINIIGGEKTNLLRDASLAVLVISVVLTPLANFLWRPVWRRFPAIERATFPDLNGTWEGEIVTTWTGPGSGTSPSPIPTTVRIKQSLFSTSVHLRTGESHSYSTWCHLEADRKAGVYRVRYFYDNRPKAEVNSGSRRHEGAAWLELNIDEDRNRLVGQYFTDRRTTGDMSLHRAASR